MTRSEDRLRAVQGAWPSAKPLTRRERAAMSDALETLRSEALDGAPAPVFTALTDALIVLMIAWDRGAAMCGVIRTAALHARYPRDMPGAERRDRLIRARLALYLRARLRADRGDCGPTEWVGCRCNCDGDNGGWMPRRITPLWERASDHG